MTSNNNHILTPVGRLVQGSCFTGYDKDMEGKPLTIKTGANAGQPRVQYFMALAIEKTNPDITNVLTKIAEVARQAFPTLHDAQGNCTKADFAWKITDGDQHPDKEGFAGCWVFKLSGGFAPKVRGNDPSILLTEEGSIKRGDYIRAYININGNGSTIRPGVFLNPVGVQFVAYGEEIITVDDGKDAFGAAPISGIPAGASAVPTAPASSPFAPPATAGVQGVQPHPGFLNVSKP